MDAVGKVVMVTGVVAVPAAHPPEAGYAYRTV